MYKVSLHETGETCLPIANCCGICHHTVENKLIIFQQCTSQLHVHKTDESIMLHVQYVSNIREMDIAKMTTASLIGITLLYSHFPLLS